MNRRTLELISLLILLIISCQNKIIIHSESSKPLEELWEDGIYQLIGRVESVEEDEKGQYIILLEDSSSQKFVWIIIENFKKNSSNYRQISKGEYIGFRGNYDPSGNFVAIEILETK